MSTENDPTAGRKIKVCSFCGKEFKSAFGLTYSCDQCYRKSYAATKANYAASGHFYPWTIDGKIRTRRRI